jgi:hypothetical protein
MLHLGSLGGQVGVGNAINARGVVVGASSLASEPFACQFNFHLSGRRRSPAGIRKLREIATHRTAQHWVRVVSTRRREVSIPALAPMDSPPHRYSSLTKY